jgi:hypothetical protein
MKNKKTLLGFNKKKLTQWLLYWTVLGAGMFMLIFLITSTWIGVSVKEKCQVAQGKYQSDCTQALMATLSSEQESFRNKNYAIWSLGQLGDDQALPLLKSLYTGVIPEREPYDADISQYELKKAIVLLEGGFNITSWVWRQSN